MPAYAEAIFKDVFLKCILCYNENTSLFSFFHMTLMLVLLNLLRFPAASSQIRNLLFLKPEKWYTKVI